MDVENRVKVELGEWLIENIKKLPITLNSSFITDFGMDFLDIVELIVRMEEEFGIDITEEGVRCYDKEFTVGELIKLVKIGLDSSGENGVIKVGEINL